MKCLFRFAGMFACLGAAQAHESWAPHTHLVDQQHSDAFVMLLGVMAVLGIGFLLIRGFRKRYKPESSGPCGILPARTRHGQLQDDHRVE